MISKCKHQILFQGGNDLGNLNCESLVLQYLFVLCFIIYKICDRNEIHKYFFSYCKLFEDSDDFLLYLRFVFSKALYFYKITQINLFKS